MATYDKHYKEHNYFGKPYSELMDFFRKYPNRGKLVDLGAGQGRDSIPLSEMGYDVTAVDISEVGLKQIKYINPSIHTIKTNAYEFDISDYDFILLDSMIHFYMRHIKRESKWLINVFSSMKKNSVFINCLLKSPKSEKILFEIFNEFNHEFDIIENKYIDYPEANCKYHLFVIKKK